MKYVGKSQGFCKGQKWKGVANKGSLTKPSSNHINIIEAQFVRLEILVANMASNMVAHACEIQFAQVSWMS